MMKKTMQLIMAGTLMAATAGYCDVLLSEDFETGQTIGTSPTGATTVRPSSPTASGFTYITGSATNTAGSGNGVHFYDSNSSDGNMLTYNFVADAASQLSAVRVDFSFAALATAGAGDDYIAVAFGEYSTSKTLNASARRFTDMRLYNDGTVDFRSYLGSGAPYSNNHDISSGSHDISIFVNDALASVNYTGLDSSAYVLAANSVAYWLDGALVVMNGGEEFTTMDLDDATASGTVGTTADNLGKFGFNTGTSDVGLNYAIDDIEISTIPEPAALSMLGLAAAGFIFIRRLIM